MEPEKNSDRKDERYRGFTLIEMAIVLGVIGVILAGVFAAASYANHNLDLNTGSDQLNQIVINMRALYAGQNAATATGANATLIGQGVFPADMVSQTPPNGKVANNVWVQDPINGTAQVSVVAGGPGTSLKQFDVEYLEIPASVCTSLIMRNSQPGRDTGLTEVCVGTCLAGTVFTGTALPVTAINAAGACAGAGPFTIDWLYNLNG